MHRPLLLLILVAMIVAFTGCTAMTKDQKEWIEYKAARSHQMVKWLKDSQLTEAQKDAWILSQDDSWSLWEEKIKLGLAVPNWMADAKYEEKQKAAIQFTPQSKPAKE